MGINTHHEPVIYMREDCEICQSEGFSANSRLLLECAGQSIIATLNIVDNPVLAKGYAGLSKIAMQRLMVQKGDILDISQAPVVSSLSQKEDLRQPAQPTGYAGHHHGYW